MSKKHGHYWLSIGIPHPLEILNGKFKYACSVCERAKYFRHAPVNPVVSSAWDVYGHEVRSGRAHLVMAPPVLPSQESMYAEGERYAKLIKEVQ